MVVLLVLSAPLINSWNHKMGVNIVPHKARLPRRRIYMINGVIFCTVLSFAM